MSCDAAIACSNLSKAYAIYNRPLDRLVEWLTGSKEPRGELFWALRDVSVEIRPGQTVGVIGRNGSGKSTLLQLITGVLCPTEGAVRSRGRIAALLELGTGFNPEFTGRENIRLGASLLGLTPDAIEIRLPQIERFADIGHFFDHPFRMYSSGMQARLAFALVTNVDADILIIDEALSVGDAAFSQKCMRFLRTFRERGTLCFVSHDTAAVINLCDTALWLDGGRVRAYDQARTVCREYAVVVQGQTRHQSEYCSGGRSLAPPPAAPAPSPLLTAPVEDLPPCSLTEAELTDEAGTPIRALRGQERLCLHLRGQFSQHTVPLQASFVFKDRLGQPLFGATATLENPPAQNVGNEFQAEFRFTLPALRAGDFAFTLVLSKPEADPTIIYDRNDEAIVVRVDPAQVTHGLLPIPLHVTYSISVAAR